MSKSDLMSRKGRVKVSLDIIHNNPELVAEAMKGSLVLRAECQHMFHKIVYDCVHPNFDLVELGETVPDYQCVISTNNETGKLQQIEFIKI